MDKETSEAIDELWRLADRLVQAARQGSNIGGAKIVWTESLTQQFSPTIDLDILPTGTLRVDATGGCLEVSASRRGEAFSVLFDRGQYTRPDDPSLHLVQDATRRLERALLWISC